LKRDEERRAGKEAVDYLLPPEGRLDTLFPKRLKKKPEETVSNEIKDVSSEPAAEPKKPVDESPVPRPPDSFIEKYFGRFFKK
jgi:hypothetical protein